MTDDEILEARMINLGRLKTMSDHDLLCLLPANYGPRAHDMGCRCGGINATTGLCCRELWDEIDRRVKR